MNDELEGLFKKLKDIEAQIETIIEARRASFISDIKEGKARFDEATLKGHRAIKKGIKRYIFDSNFATVITAPFIYGMIIPFAFLDLSLFIYQATCFSAWQLPKVKRSNYIIIDRQHLAYLNGIEKINCMFCGYCNGLISYLREITSVTEQYWCPIKHAQRLRDQHEYYKNFVEYGDAEGFKRESEPLRQALRKPKTPKPKPKEKP